LSVIHFSPKTNAGCKTTCTKRKGRPSGTAQALLAFGVLFYLLPWMGLGLLDTARELAEFDLPMRVLRLWWGNP